MSLFLISGGIWVLFQFFQLLNSWFAIVILLKIPVFFFNISRGGERHSSRVCKRMNNCILFGIQMQVFGEGIMIWYFGNSGKKRIEVDNCRLNFFYY
ncbi:hypothetical protein HanRHA438_Chr11g0514871 [Helianthus annuus]|nr:hypothetical protein HanIR_Chr11g0540681 [Helianthus annuus]KAJ0871647.1 hypothetical protein HanRHA438_Chr11g0514871 [Helianthus annuus]